MWNFIECRQHSIKFRKFLILIFRNKGLLRTMDFHLWFSVKRTFPAWFFFFFRDTDFDTFISSKFSKIKYCYLLLFHPLLNKLNHINKFCVEFKDTDKSNNENNKQVASTSTKFLNHRFFFLSLTCILR